MMRRLEGGKVRSSEKWIIESEKWRREAWIRKRM
jgi:hypothetical protein